MLRPQIVNFFLAKKKYRRERSRGPGENGLKDCSSVLGKKYSVQKFVHVRRSSTACWSSKKAVRSPPLGDDGVRTRGLKSRYQWKVCFKAGRSEIHRQRRSGSGKVVARRGWITTTKSNDTTPRGQNDGELDYTIRLHGAEQQETKQKKEYTYIHIYI